MTSVRRRRRGGRRRRKRRRTRTRTRRTRTRTRIRIRTRTRTRTRTRKKNKSTKAILIPATRTTMTTGIIERGWREDNHVNEDEDEIDFEEDNGRSV